MNMGMIFFLTSESKHLGALTAQPLPRGVAGQRHNSPPPAPAARGHGPVRDHPQARPGGDTHHLDTNAVGC